MKYNVDYFIAKFEKIPEDRWAIMTRQHGNRRCALGWCYQSDKDAALSETCSIQKSEEELALRGLVLLLNPLWGAGGVNNGMYPEYQQPTPKQRILAALYDIKKMQQPEVREDITKQLAVESVSETLDVVPFTASVCSSTVTGL